MISDQDRPASISEKDWDRLYLGEGIEFHMADLRPGVKFDTAAEQGCVVADPPDFESLISNRYGTRFQFAAIDSEGVCCTFDSRMITWIHRTEK